MLPVISAGFSWHPLLLRVFQMFLGVEGSMEGWVKEDSIIVVELSWHCID